MGNQNAAERAEIISCFEQAEVGVLGNVKVLSEGVDIPLIDSVYFVDPKTSLIDLVQAIGRALRKPYGSDTKVSKVIVPIQVSSTVQDLDDVRWDGTFQTFHNVIQAMRDQDQRLAEEINEINLYAVSKGKRGTRIGSGGKIRISMPAMELAKTVNLEEFMDKITLRVARANANPEGKKLGFSHLGKGERKSKYKSVFGLLGDYNPDYYQHSLVEPTLERFPHLNYEGTKSDLEVRRNGHVSHNNVPYTARLGVIRKLDGKKYRLSTLGRKLKEGQLSFNEVLRNQLLLYRTDNDLYSYRVLLDILLRVGTLNNYTEFLYGPYAIQQNEYGRFDIEGAVERILYIQREFPYLDWTSLGNRNEVRELLNERCPVEFTEEDVWGDRLTIANKFRYTKNFLALFDFLDCHVGYQTPISINPGRQDDLVHILEISDPRRAPMTDFYGEWYWDLDI